MGRCGYVPLRRLGDVPLRRCWVLDLRLVWHVLETYWWDVAVTSSWDVITTLSVSFKTYLRRHWDIQRDILMMSLWRLVAGWIFILQCLFICFDIYLSHYSLKFFQSSLKGFIFELRDVNFVDLYLRFDVNKDWCLQPNASSLRKSKFHRLRMVPQLSFLHYLLFF